MNFNDTEMHGTRIKKRQFHVFFLSKYGYSVFQNFALYLFSSWPRNATDRLAKLFVAVHTNRHNWTYK